MNVKIKTMTPEEYYEKAIAGSEAAEVIEENHLKMTVLKVLKNYHEVNYTQQAEHIKHLEEGMWLAIKELGLKGGSNYIADDLVKLLNQKDDE